MELDWFEDFLALADSGNFNRAATLRHLTQPAFSRRIRALEDWAGAPLFDRSTHRVGLTEAGEALLPRAADIVRQVEQARVTVRETADAEAATLRFAATHALSLTFVPGWLRGLERHAPLDGLHVMSDTMRACEAALRRGQVQFLLCHQHAALPEPLEASHFLSRSIGEDRLVPVAAPDAAGAPRFALPGTVETPVPLLAYSPESALGWIVKTIQIEPLHLDTLVTAHLASVLLAMVRDGRGLAWLPLSLAREDLAEGRLVRAGGADWEIPLDLRLYRPRARQAPAAEAFWARVGESDRPKNT